MAMPPTMSMSSKWSRKKPHFPLLAVLFIFIACSVLYNEFSVQRIHESTDHVPSSQPTPSTYVKPNLPQRASEVLDRFSGCNSTRNFSGKKTGRPTWRRNRVGGGVFDTGLVRFFYAFSFVQRILGGHIPVSMYRSVGHVCTSRKCRLRVRTTQATDAM
ncbi:protein trichome birefringence-like 35 [Hibiscus syriacus]|uniref:protein trichome birefringence-like 35 n=1 Tax=Hibiscus syriacus TaxID=106335 RepID=UPI001922639B|nr:protein trichome birefringence-like 35 [Hibiscus syriacus]